MGSTYLTCLVTISVAVGVENRDSKYIIAVMIVFVLCPHFTYKGIVPTHKLSFFNSYLR